ncbi:hypothetical protein ABZZ79_31025 [Streptomyces sp. NPDC006458]|uniref:hypothetical protein n=1 Tax=Streptomyces sp. NPDC006458 TaxID=3154302 RepID=UPI0033A0CEE3
MKYGSLAAGAASAAAVVALAVWVDADGTGRGGDGAPAESRKAARGCVGGRPGSAGTGDAPEDSPLYRTLARIDELATGRHSGVFAGLAVDEDTNAADVWRIPSTAFEEAVCAAAEQGVRVRFHDADANRRDLDALADRVGEDMSRWEGTFQMREVGVDERGYVRIGVDDPDTARPLIEREFGTEHIRVEQVDQARLD